MDSVTLKLMPGRAVALVWIKQILARKQGYFSKRSKRIIELTSGTSAAFAIGRQKSNNHPVIAVPDAMSPWFPTLDIKKCVVIDKSIYLGIGAEEIEFFFRIKSNEARIGTLMPINERSTDLIRTVDFHSYVVDEKGKTHVSTALGRAEIVYLTDIGSLIPLDEDLKDELWSEDLMKDIDFEDADLFDTLQESLPENFNSIYE
ncbi:hypothetical protein [Vibrio alginolyticus]|uniref:hypothetical protein n=1 Tax=Vibrio alginolyticus TaxID=663 RepID=UPI0006CA7C3E|nr:hypothetical protein [Vibrio alginolyticus]KPM98490.1 hypothetical protein AOG25_08580 [Vibrio alginolyticus]